MDVYLELLINILSWRDSECWDDHSVEKQCFPEEGT